MRRLVALAVAILASSHGAAWAVPSCPGTGRVTVFVNNLSDSPTVDVALDGNLAAGAATCTGTGATSYPTTMMTCTGSGLVRCGEIPGLLPGAWIHRLDVTVPGSSRQQQAERLVVVAGAAQEVSNAVVWTIYPRTYVVRSTNADGTDGLPDPDGLPAKLDEATAFTLCDPRPVLITFAPDVFPGAASPQRVFVFQSPCRLAARNLCSPSVAPDSCPCQPGAGGCSVSGALDGSTAGLCVAGDRIVVDGLDHDAETGGVILSVDTCGRQLLRVYGSDDVFRGLVFEGSQKSCTTSTCLTYCKPPTCTPSCFQVDTVDITGARALRDRIEQSIVIGPTCGDALTVEQGAGQTGDGSGDAVIAESEIRGGEDKGVKVDFGGAAVVASSCVHDNRNGGIQSTLGGHVMAVENVVQHNVPGAAQNGLSVRGDADLSTLFTDGNVVRLNGGRGLSVTDNAAATFANDYVADNQYSGSKVETTVAGTTPFARFHGVALVCNRHAGLSGLCDPSPPDVELPCTTVEDCCTGADGSVDPVCVASSHCLQGSFPRGLGAATSQATGTAPPDVSYGDALQAGRNVFTNNQNLATGANFKVSGVDGTIPALGNQWEHCPTGSPCDVTPDLSPPDAMVDVGVIPDPRAKNEFQLLRVTPPRPRAGDIVRVYGVGFDAIDGNPGGRTCSDLVACAADGSCPSGPCVDGACPCAVENAAVQLRNQQTVANRIRFKGLDGVALTDAAGRRYFYPDAVTPTMLALRMPFDCFAPLRLEVTKHDAAGNPVPISISVCDSKGCQDEPAGAPCDDGSVCTLDDRCDGGGHCVGGAPLVCDGPCLGCDPVAGCVPKPATAPCDDGNACTAGEHCSGVGNDCIGGQRVSCAGQCLTGDCDPLVGCVPRAADVSCTDGDVCTVGDHCSGTGDVCMPGSPLSCDGACQTGRCDHILGCELAPVTQACDDGNACTVGDHCSGVSTRCESGTPRVCAGRCLTGACDPQIGCVAKEGVKALTCRVNACRRGRLRRRLEELATSIDHAVDAGGQPRRRAIRRLTQLLARCGV